MLGLGASVVISSRSATDVSELVTTLSAEFPNRVFGCDADVSTVDGRSELGYRGPLWLASPAAHSARWEEQT